MSYKYQVTHLVALGCLVWGVHSGIPTQINSVIAQTNVSQNEQFFAQNRQTATNDRFTAELNRCTRLGRIVRCELVFRGKKDFDSHSIYCSYDETKLYDYSGNPYLCNGIQAGNESGKESARTRFPQGTPVKVILTFNEIPETTNEFQTFEIHHGNYGYYLRFRNVKVSR